MSDNTGTTSEGNQGQEQQVPQRPDGLPDAFWDADKNEIKTADIISGYNELSQFKTENEKRFAARPEAADKYAFPDASVLGLPEGATFEFDEKSPLFSAAREAAFNAGMSQDEFTEKLIKPYVQEQLSAVTKAEEQYQTELKALGEKAQDRIEAVGKFLEANLPKEMAEALGGSLVTAKGVEAVEALIAKANGATIKTADNGSSAAKVSEKDLRSKMMDPKYWRDRDPAIVKEVTEGFAKLYPGKLPATGQRTSSVA